MLLVFITSNLPFKYSGVPISSRRISTAQCGVVVDKMTARLKIWTMEH